MVEGIAGFVVLHLVFFVAVLLVPVKWVLLRIIGDIEGQTTAFLAFPEDLCYVALGIVLGDLATSGKAFERHYHSSHVLTNIAVVAAFNVLVALGVHALARKGNDHFANWRAAGHMSIDPCPEGLEEAEKVVEFQRQKLFGGPLRQTTFTASWKRA